VTSNAMRWGCGVAVLGAGQDPFRATGPCRCRNPDPSPPPVARWLPLNVVHALTVDPRTLSEGAGRSGCRPSKSPIAPSGTTPDHRSTPRRRRGYRDTRGAEGAAATLISTVVAPGDLLAIAGRFGTTPALSDVEALAQWLRTASQRLAGVYLDPFSHRFGDATPESLHRVAYECWKTFRGRGVYPRCVRPRAAHHRGLVVRRVSSMRSGGDSPTERRGGRPPDSIVVAVWFTALRHAAWSAEIAGVASGSATGAWSFRHCRRGGRVLPAARHLMPSSNSK